MIAHKFLLIFMIISSFSFWCQGETTYRFTVEDCKNFLENPPTFPKELESVPPEPVKAPYFYIRDVKSKQSIEAHVPYGSYELILNTSFHNVSHTGFMIKDDMGGLPKRSSSGGSAIYHGGCFIHDEETKPSKLTSFRWKPPFHVGQPAQIEALVLSTNGVFGRFKLDSKAREPDCSLEKGDRSLVSLLGEGTNLGNCVPDQNFHSEGERYCSYSCNPGYAPRTARNVYCHNGTWQTKSGSSFSACQKIPDFCKETEIPSKRETEAYIRGSACTVAAVNESCSFQCKNGHVMEHNITCLETGKFEVPRCRYVGKCAYKDLVLIDKNVLRGTCSNLSGGESCSYKCPLGYKPRHEMVFCTGNGWSRQAKCELIPDFCSIKDIKGPHVLPGTCTDRSILDNSYCTFACESGYIPIYAKLNCNSRGIIDYPSTGGWNHGPFECRKDTTKRASQDEERDEL